MYLTETNLLNNLKLKHTNLNNNNTNNNNLFSAIVHITINENL